jgi:hypothetical protein
LQLDRLHSLHSLAVHAATLTLRSAILWCESEGSEILRFR